ncbi:hypothetical protein EYA82_19730 [Burkholderia pseudomallei]|nr:hypothetical protein EYA82_19730 [Burkholderia pseudomallei]
MTSAGGDGIAPAARTPRGERWGCERVIRTHDPDVWPACPVRIPGSHARFACVTRAGRTQRVSTVVDRNRRFPFDADAMRGHVARPDETWRRPDTRARRRARSGAMRRTASATATGSPVAAG